MPWDNDLDEEWGSKIPSSISESDTDWSLGSSDNEDAVEPPTPSRHRVRYELHKTMQAALLEEAEIENIFKELTRALADANEIILKKQDQIEELQKMKGRLEQGQGENSDDNPPVPGCSLALLPIQQGDNGKLEKKKDILTMKETFSPELIFPEEVWEMITNYLSDSSDLWNVSMSCGLLQKVLYRNKYLWMFDMLFPILFSHLDKETILTLRLVCKRWNGVVDNYFENHPSLSAYSEKNDDHRSPLFRSPMREKGIGLYTFSNSLELCRTDLRTQDFLRKMRNHPRNPFIGRHLSVSKWPYLNFGMAIRGADSDNSDIEEELDYDDFQSYRYWRRVTKFLEVFGQHIWYLTFASLDKIPTTLGRRLIHKFLTRDVFILCPNLKKLRVRGILVKPEKIEKGALPPARAPNLHTLQLDNIIYDPIDNLPAALVQNYFQQLNGLDVKGHCWRTMSHLDWTNLTELYLNMMADKDEDLAALLNLNVPNLVKLGLKLKAFSDAEFGLLLQVTIKLSERAPHFNSLRLYKGYSAEQVNCTPDHLYGPPNLTTLEFQSVFSDSPSSSFAFLMRFPSIKNLNIYWPTTFEAGRPDVNYHSEHFGMCNAGKEDLWVDLVQLREFMYVKRMYESNVWILLPRLNVFTFQKKLYTRHGYEEFTRKRLQCQPIA